MVSFFSSGFLSRMHPRECQFFFFCFGLMRRVFVVRYFSPSSAGRCPEQEKMSRTSSVALAGGFMYGIFWTSLFIPPIPPISTD